MSTTTAMNSEKSRSWFQFGTRSLLVLTFVAAIFFVWLGWKFKQAEQQRQIVEKHGVWLSYDFEVDQWHGEETWFCSLFPPEIAPEPPASMIDDSISGSNLNPPGPRWLIALVGVDFLFSVKEAHYVQDVSVSPQVASDFTRALNNLPQLRQVQLWTPGSLAEFENLSHCTSLQELHLAVNEIDGERMSHLASLPELQALCLNHGKLSDDAFQSLCSAPQLKHFEYYGPDMMKTQHLQQIGQLRSLEYLLIPNIPSPSSMQNLGALKLLKTLWVDLRLSDEVVEHFSALEHLEELHFSTPHMSLQGWEALHSLKHLKKLTVEAEAISENDLTQMNRFTKLKKLEFHCDNELTVEKVANLKKALPNTNIIAAYPGS